MDNRAIKKLVHHGLSPEQAGAVIAAGVFTPPDISEKRVYLESKGVDVDAIEVALQDRKDEKNAVKGEEKKEVEKVEFFLDSPVPAPAKTKGKGKKGKVTEPVISEPEESGEPLADEVPVDLVEEVTIVELVDDAGVDGA